MDALTDESPPGILWSRVNTAETFPGVVTPMTWSFYGEPLESAIRLGFADLGIIPPSAAPYPDGVGERIIGVFYGRMAANVDVCRRVMSGLPGMTGDDVERDLLGSARDGIVDEGYPRRTPAVLLKAPLNLATKFRKPKQIAAEGFAWLADRVGPDGPRPGVDPRSLLREALDLHARATRLQGRTRMLYQGSLATLIALAEQAGKPDAAAALMGGSAGTEETVVADDLHLLANQSLSLSTFLERHGFHGPNSSELSSLSWREDPEPLERLLPAMKEAQPPAERRAESAAARRQAAAEVLAGLPAIKRAGARVALRTAPVTTRQIENTKTTFLLATDGARAAVRAIGGELTAARRLEEPDDAFHLFAHELLNPGSVDHRSLAAERKLLHQRYAEIELPETWEGQPQPEVPGAPDEDRDVRAVSGLGASPGIVEGRVRVVLDAAGEVDIDAGEVLVCPTTDPSWLALMSIASALVIDIGANASHGAIVARELGVPCVIGTGSGTTDLHDGDTVRVDGARGEVEVLERAGA